MKLISVLSVVLVASMVVPQTSAWWLRCDTFDSYKGDVSRWFSYRDSRINSAYSYVASANSKACSAYSMINSFNSAHSKMEALIKKQASINSRLYSEVSFLYRENKELEDMLARMKSMAAAAQKKNSDQDGQLGSLRGHDSKQNYRLYGQERINSDQYNQINAVRSADSAQESRLNGVRDANKKQDDSMNMLRAKNSNQDSAIGAGIDKNNAQDSALGNEIARNNAQEALLNKITEDNGVQEKKIDTIKAAIDHIRKTTIGLVGDWIKDVSTRMHKSAFTKDMFLAMLNSYI